MLKRSILMKILIGRSSFSMATLMNCILVRGQYRRSSRSRLYRERGFLLTVHPAGCFAYSAVVISPADLPGQLQLLLDERQRHIESIARIDQTMAGVLAVLDGIPTAPAALIAIERADLTRRERQTLRHLLRGRSEAEAARRIRVSTSTVHIYVRQLFKKFRVNSRAKLMALFLTDVAGVI
jgi:DNA-binding NarL/FixJ family response regulator